MLIMPSPAVGAGSALRSVCVLPVIDARYRKDVLSTRHVLRLQPASSSERAPICCPMPTQGSAKDRVSFPKRSSPGSLTTGEVGCPPTRSGKHDVDRDV